MSRRCFLLLGCVGIVTAAAFSWYLPRAFSPVPGLVAELKSYLQEHSNDAGAEKLAADPNVRIEIMSVTAGFNATLAETTIFAPDAAPGARFGVVSDTTGLYRTLTRLANARCMREMTASSVRTSSGCLAFTDSVSLPAGVAADGTMTYVITLQVLPTLCRDDRIHVQLGLTEIEEVDAAPAAARNPPLRLLKSSCSMVLRDGETCVIGGQCRKQHVFGEFRVPLLCDLPVVGTSFAFPRECDIDEELLIFATVKRVAAPR